MTVNANSIRREVELNRFWIFETILTAQIVP